MRILFNPVYSSRFIEASSSLNFFRAFNENVLKKYPDTVFYVLFPKINEESKWLYVKENLNLPRTHIIEVPMYENQFDELMLVTRDFWELFNERFGKHYFHAILNEHTNLAPFFRKLSNFHLQSKSRKTVIVNRDQILLNTEWFKIDPIEELMQCSGVLSAPTIFQSNHQKDKLLWYARKWFSGSKLLELAKNCHVHPLGVDCDDIDRINLKEREEKPKDKILINYSHKLFMGQKFIESFKIMDSVFAGGRPVELQIVTGSSKMKLSMIKEARKFQYITIFDRQNREQFLKQSAKAHVFISNSYWEDFSATVVEQLYSGLIPVLKDESWSRYLLPEGYPYLFKSMDEGQMMLRYVVDNYEKVRDEWQEKIIIKVRKEFDLKKVALDIFELCKSEYDKERFNVSKGLDEVIENAYKSLPDEFDLDQFYDEIKNNSIHMDVRKDRESMSISKWLCADYLIKKYNPIDLGEFVPRYRKNV